MSRNCIHWTRQILIALTCDLSCRLRTVTVRQSTSWLISYQHSDTGHENDAADPQHCTNSELRVCSLESHIMLHCGFDWVCMSMVRRYTIGFGIFSLFSRLIGTSIFPFRRSFGRHQNPVSPGLSENIKKTPLSPFSTIPRPHRPISIDLARIARPTSSKHDGRLTWREMVQVRWSAVKWSSMVGFFERRSVESRTSSGPVS